MKVFNKKGFAALAAAALLAAACGGGSSTSKELIIGISLPLSGSALASAGPAQKGAELAVSEVTLEGGYTLKTIALDHAVNGAHDPAQAAADMTTLVGNAQVIGVVGPFNSGSAKAQIPVSSAAGLLQCSPSNTNPDLTKGDAGAALREGRPANYFRLATTDDIQGPAVAQWAFSKGYKAVYIVDDTEVYGKGIADAFAAEFESLGGTVVGRSAADKTVTDFSAIITEAKGLNPDSFFYGGVTSSGAGLVRKAMIQSGLAVPFFGGDGIQDGNGDGSYIAIAGADAADSYSSVAAIHDIPDAAAFAAKYSAKFGEDPGAYSAAAYACVQVMVEGIKAAIAGGTVTRETVRAAVMDPSKTYSTVLGTVGLDENGDTTQKIISLYKVENGDWVFDSQVDAQ